ncbi:hypothetical protein DFQ27_001498 [Actinomortierella ambigua]|uniref:DUF5648 domain-containing protein n=1 Tax=Actinomortierella ambigua TaxID=1343610 RepID=A0A9P6U8Q5_9FUNG|nr:hypothetical protein DFQ27_001498 [Actinomortierella ambigua]
MDNNFFQPTDTSCPLSPSSEPVIQPTTTAIPQSETMDVDSGSLSFVYTGLQDPPPTMMITPAPTILSNSAAADLALALSSSLYGVSDISFGTSDIDGAELPSLYSDPMSEQQQQQQQQLRSDPVDQSRSMSIATDVLIHLADIRDAFNVASRTSLLEYKKLAQQTLDRVDNLQEDMDKIKRRVKDIDEDLGRLQTSSSETTDTIEDLRATADTIQQAISEAFSGLQQTVLDGLGPLRQSILTMQRDIVGLQLAVEGNTVQMRNTEQSVTHAQQYLIGVQKSTRRAANEVAHMQAQSVRLQKDIVELPSVIVTAMTTNMAAGTTTTSSSATATASDSVTSAADAAADAVAAATVAADAPLSSTPSQYTAAAVDRPSETTTTTTTTMLQEILGQLQQISRTITHDQVLKDILAEVSAARREPSLVDWLYRARRSTRSKRSREEDPEQEGDKFGICSRNGQAGLGEGSQRQPPLKKERRSESEDEEEVEEEDDDDDEEEDEEETEGEEGEEENELESGEQDELDDDDEEEGEGEEGSKKDENEEKQGESDKGHMMFQPRAHSDCPNQSGDHFYTVDPQDYRPHGYTFEGIVGYLYPTLKPNTVAFHHWYHPKCDNFYTMHEFKGPGPQGYEYHGIVGYLYPSAVQGTVPLLRWWNGVDHFYCTDPGGELAPRVGYSFEGVEGYLFPSPVEGTIPLFRWFTT